MAAPPSPPAAPLYLLLDTDLGTRLAVPVAPDTTICRLKSKVAEEHAAAFPEHRPVSVKSIQIRRKGALYHLCESSTSTVSAFTGHVLHVKMAEPAAPVHCRQGVPQIDGRRTSEGHTGIHVEKHVRERLAATPENANDTGLGGDDAYEVELTKRDGTKARPSVVLSSSKPNDEGQVGKHVQFVSDAQASTDLTSEQGYLDHVHNGDIYPSIVDSIDSTAEVPASGEQIAEGSNGRWDGRDKHEKAKQHEYNEEKHDGYVAGTSNVEKDGKNTDASEKRPTTDNVSQEKKHRKAKKVTFVDMASMDTADDKEMLGHPENAGKSDKVSIEREIVHGPSVGPVSDNVQHGDSNVIENRKGDRKQKRKRRRQSESSKGADPNQDQTKSPENAAGTHDNENAAGYPTEPPIGQKDDTTLKPASPNGANVRKKRKKSLKTELQSRDFAMEHDPSADLVSCGAENSLISPKNSADAVEPDRHIVVHPASDEINLVDHFSSGKRNDQLVSAENKQNNEDENARDVKNKKKKKKQRTGSTEPNDLLESLPAEKTSLTDHFGANEVIVPSVEECQGEYDNVKGSKGKKKRKRKPNSEGPPAEKENLDGDHQGTGIDTQDSLHSVVQKEKMGQNDGNENNNKVAQNEPEDGTCDHTVEKKLHQDDVDAQENLPISKDNANISKELRKSTSQKKPNGDKYALSKEVHCSKKKKGYTPSVQLAITEIENKISSPTEGEQPNSATHVVANVLAKNTHPRSSAQDLEAQLEEEKRKNNELSRQVGLLSKQDTHPRSSAQDLEAQLEEEKRKNNELSRQMGLLAKQVQETEQGRIRDREEMTKKQNDLEAKFALLVSKI